MDKLEYDIYMFNKYQKVVGLFLKEILEMLYTGIDLNKDLKNAK